MTNEKTEFESKGVPSELITDNGNAYQSKGILRGHYKGPEERKAVRKKIDGYMNPEPSSKG